MLQGCEPLGFNPAALLIGKGMTGSAVEDKNSRQKTSPVFYLKRFFHVKEFSTSKIFQVQELST
jgi:hypothetical protein